jgi:hypothetical protein
MLKKLGGNMDTKEVLMAIGLVGTFLGVIMVYKTLKSNHDWYRRQYTLDILKEWNENIMPLVKIIEDVFPHLLDIDGIQSKGVELTREEAEKIYAGDTKDNKYINLRYTLNSLMNYFEYIATAYLHNVADQRIIFHSFSKSLIRIHDALDNYIEVVKRRRGHQPWQPFLDVISKWKAQDARPLNQKPTDRLFRRTSI